LDEGERMILVADYHKREKVKLPNWRLHAAIHTAVENQLAEGLPVPKETLQRLMAEGLGRHDAVHAIGSVLAAHMHRALQPDAGTEQTNDRYYLELRELTAESWREQGE
jgi:hypothetical protein